MACNVHIDLVLRTIAGAPAELLASSMRLLPETLFLVETRAGMQKAIYANEAFLQLGHSTTSVLDPAPRFLQDHATGPSSSNGFLQPHPKAHPSRQAVVRLRQPFSAQMRISESAELFAENNLCMSFKNQ